MSWIQNALNGTPMDSTLLFLVTLILLSASAYVGKFVFKTKHTEFNDDEAKLVLGGILSLLGLLIAFVLSISIGGYNDRQKTEENEMVVIGTALQRTQLLPSPQREKAEQLLHEYLDTRIEFFRSGSQPENRKWRMISSEKQSQLWEIGVIEAGKTPTAVMDSILKSYNDLYIAQERTTVSWRHQVPNIVWALLIFFAIFSNFFIGYNVRKERGMNILILILPFLITLALFIIADIDIPAEGVIHVTPDDLLALKAMLQLQTK